MGILDRLVTVVKSNINDLISRAEDPEKMLNQIIEDMRQKIAEAKKSVIEVMATEKRLEAQYKKEFDEAEKWQGKARLALEKGDENLAKEALVRKSEVSQRGIEYKEQWQAQKSESDAIQAALRKLVNKYEEANRKKGLLIAKQKRAEAQKKVASTMSSISDSGAFSHFARMEDKVHQISAEADAATALNKSMEGTDLDAKFKELEAGSSSVDDELAALKAKMNKG